MASRILLLAVALAALLLDMTLVRARETHPSTPATDCGASPAAAPAAPAVQPSTTAPAPPFAAAFGSCGGAEIPSSKR